MTKKKGRGRPALSGDKGELFAFRAKDDLKEFLKSLKNKNQFIVETIEGCVAFREWRAKKAEIDYNSSPTLFD